MDSRQAGSRFGDEERLRSAPATSDQGHTEHFTDAEAALLRHLRFGRLPEPVLPSDWAETVDADTQFEPAQPRLDPPHAS